MMLKLRPPELKLTAELEWLIQRSFCRDRLGSEFAGGLNPEGAVSLVADLDLGGRLVTRAGVGPIRTEIGEVAADAVFSRYRGAAVNAVALEKWASRVEACASTMSIPVVMMKGIALQRQIDIQPGARTISDIDVLAPDDQARRLHSSLAQLGLRAPNVHEREHHLPALRNENGITVEIHTKLLGIRLNAGRSSATFQELADRGLCVYDDLAGDGDSTWRLDADVLVAHLIVHALIHHQHDPDGYVSLRLLGDLADLNWSEERWSEFRDRAALWLGRDIDADGLEAVGRLVLSLGDGVPIQDILDQDREEALILRHLVASQIDPVYKEKLRAQRLTHRLTDRSASLNLVIRAKRNLFLSGDEVEYRYGLQPTVSATWRRRIAHPFSVGYRVVKGYLGQLRANLK